MGSRRTGRVLAMQALFAWDMSHSGVEDLCGFAWIDDEQSAKFDSSTRDFARMLVAGVLENIDTVDEDIRSHLEHWDFSRISRVDLAVLRLGVYSLRYQPDIPATVSIDEAIEIAKEFSGDDSYRFVNGVLDGVRRELQ